MNRRQWTEKLKIRVFTRKTLDKSSGPPESRLMHFRGFAPFGLRFVSKDNTNIAIEDYLFGASNRSLPDIGTYRVFPLLCSSAALAANSGRHWPLITFGKHSSILIQTFVCSLAVFLNTENSTNVRHFYGRQSATNPKRIPTVRQLRPISWLLFSIFI